MNIGNPDERTIQELAVVMREVTGRNSGITFEPLPPQDPQVRQPDMSKNRAEIGWEPDIALREGLKRSL